MNTKKYSQETIAIVEECIKIFDIESVVEYAINHVSAFHFQVMEYVYDNIEDSEELTLEEVEYFSERVKELMDKYV